MLEDSQDTLSKAEYEALIATKDEDKQNENNITSSSEHRHGSDEAGPRKGRISGEAALGKQEVSGIGCSTKRRLAKILGEEEKEATPETNDSRKKDTKSRANRRKKMKLSFDDYTEA